MSKMELCRAERVTVSFFFLALASGLSDIAIPTLFFLPPFPPKFLGKVNSY